MGGQDRSGHTADRQKLFRGLLVEEELPKRPSQQHDQEGEELAGAQVILIFMGQNIHGGDDRQDDDQQDLKPVNPSNTYHGQQTDLEEVGERQGEGAEIMGIDTPAQHEPINGANAKQ